MGKFYPGFRHAGFRNESGLLPVRQYFQKTGEFRPPRGGEYFLSGAIPQVYEALAELTTSYYIMRPVEAPPREIEHRGFIYQRTRPL